jgi:hypothetical protein
MRKLILIIGLIFISQVAKATYIPDESSFGVVFSSPISHGTSDYIPLKAYEDFPWTIQEIQGMGEGSNTVAYGIYHSTAPNGAMTAIWTSTISATVTTFTTGTSSDYTIPKDRDLYLKFHKANPSFKNLYIRGKKKKD